MFVLRLELTTCKILKQHSEAIQMGVYACQSILERLPQAE